MSFSQFSHRRKIGNWTIECCRTPRSASDPTKNYMVGAKILLLKQSKFLLRISSRNEAVDVQALIAKAAVDDSMKRIVRPFSGSLRSPAAGCHKPTCRTPSRRIRLHCRTAWLSVPRVVPSDLFNTSLWHLLLQRPVRRDPFNCAFSSFS